MWFLIKSTVFLCMTLVVLSFFSSDEQGEKGLSAAGVTNAVISAGEIVHYMSAICVEKPEVCVKGAETLAVLGERTREGAKVAYQLLESQLGAQDGSKPDVAAAPVSTAQPSATADSDIHTATITTGTIAKLAEEPVIARIPVPLKRPANL